MWTQPPEDPRRHLVSRHWRQTRRETPDVIMQLLSLDGLGTALMGMGITLWILFLITLPVNIPLMVNLSHGWSQSSAMIATGVFMAVVVLTVFLAIVTHVFMNETLWLPVILAQIVYWPLFIVGRLILGIFQRFRDPDLMTW